MTDSILLFASRSGDIHIFDSSSIEHFDDGAPLLNLAIPVLIAGYQGIAIDELKMENGRYFHALEVNIATQEGAIFAQLQEDFENGIPLPTPSKLLDRIARAYKQGLVRDV
jgi:hypothetical protein